MNNIALPEEILLNIIKLVTARDKATLVALSLCSSQFCRLTGPILFEHLLINGRKLNNLEVILEHLHWVKKATISDICLHNTSDDDLSNVALLCQRLLEKCLNMTEVELGQGLDNKRDDFSWRSDWFLALSYLSALPKLETVISRSYWITSHVTLPLNSVKSLIMTDDIPSMSHPGLDSLRSAFPNLQRLSVVASALFNHSQYQVSLFEFNTFFPDILTVHFNDCPLYVIISQLMSCGHSGVGLELTVNYSALTHCNVTNITAAYNSPVESPGPLHILFKLPWSEYVEQNDTDFKLCLKGGVQLIAASKSSCVKVKLEFSAANLHYRLGANQSNYKQFKSDLEAAKSDRIRDWLYKVMDELRDYEKLCSSSLESWRANSRFEGERMVEFFEEEIKRHGIDESVIREMKVTYEGDEEYESRII